MSQFQFFDSNALSSTTSFRCCKPSNILKIEPLREGQLVRDRRGAGAADRSVIDRFGTIGADQPAESDPFAEILTHTRARLLPVPLVPLLLLYPLPLPFPLSDRLVAPGRRLAQQLLLQRH
jgi:hypothetical protein